MNKIYLLKNNDISLINYTSTGNGTGLTNKWENILDVNDINPIRQQLESKALRVIDFNYNYSLCKGTVNSFNADQPNVKYGKLTLTSIKTRGKGGADILPLTRFDYNLDANDVIKGSGNLYNSGTAFSSSTIFQVGELLEGDDNNANFYGVITNVTTAQGGSYIYTLMNGNGASSGNIQVRTTKNPPYNRNLYDLWRMYKSNARTDLVEKNANRYRRIDDISCKSMDVWSLRSISSPYGEKIHINYEANTYSSCLINESFPYIVTSIDKNSIVWENNKIKKSKLTLDINGFSSIYDIVDVGSTGRSVLMLNFTSTTSTKKISFSQEFVVDEVLPNSNQIVISVNNTQIGDVAVNGKTKPWYYLLWKAISDPNSLFSGMSLDKLVTGNISFYKKNRPYDYSGGVRVKTISVKSDDFFNSTTYSYSDIGKQTSSGVITYTPTTLPTYSEEVAANTDLADDFKNYRRMLYAGVNEMFNYARIIPGPVVFYEYVTTSNHVKSFVNNQITEKSGKSVYQFEVPTMRMINNSEIDVKQWNTYNGTIGYDGTAKKKMITLKDFTSYIGNLKKTITYDKDNKKLTEIINNYLHDGLENESDSLFFIKYKDRLRQRVNYQGYLHENFYETKRKQTDGSSFTQYFMTYSSRETYPCIPLGSTIINYVNGTKTTTENLSFDYYSGAVTKTLRTDASGNRFVDSTIPAYRIYPEMGLKGKDTNNKNMLTQTAASYSYAVNSSNTPIGLLSASVTTWSKDVNVLKPDYGDLIQQNTTQYGNVWRPRFSYSWMPEGATQNGMTPMNGVGMFVNFDWNNQNNPTAQNPGWQKTSELTLYDVYSHALEASDINSQYAATKMGYNHTKVMVSGGPARYAELAYCGAEDQPNGDVFNGDIHLGNASINTNQSNAHTGARSVQLSGDNGFYYEAPISKLDNQTDYYSSVWVKGDTLNSNMGISFTNGTQTVNGSLSRPNKEGWRLATLVIPATAITGSTLKVSCYNSSGTAAYFDDIRFHPLAAGITSYVYDNFSGELTYILDNNNIFTKFEYDAVGRLKKTYRETMPQGVRPVSEYLYNYGKEIFRNDLFTNYTFTKNDCIGTNVSGSTVTITIPAGQFTSFVSKEDANQLAMNWGQEQANQQGTCGSVYARVEYENQYSMQGYDYIDTYGDVVVRFYTDASCTVPFSNTAEVTYTHSQGGRSIDGNQYCNIYSNITTSIATGGFEYYIGTGILLSHMTIDPIMYEGKCEEYNEYYINYE